MSRRRPMSDRLASSGDAHGRVPPGYGERHVRTGWFGTGEARLASLVSKDRRDKPVVKLDGGKRESDGVVVPLIAGRNPAGGKGPDFGHAGRGGKRKDMTGTAQSNHPDGRLPAANARQLQNWLWATAKLSPRPAVLSMTSGVLTPHLVVVHGRREGCVTMLRRPSVSCVRENRMHSSKGGCWKRSEPVCPLRVSGR